MRVRCGGVPMPGGAVAGKPRQSASAVADQYAGLAGAAACETCPGSTSLPAQGSAIALIACPLSRELPTGAEAGQAGVSPPSEGIWDDEIVFESPTAGLKESDTGVRRALKASSGAGLAAGALSPAALAAPARRVAFSTAAASVLAAGFAGVPALSVRAEASAPPARDRS